MTLISASAVALTGVICRPGWLQIAGRRILDCGAGAPPQRPDVDLPGAVVVPGFVDVHVHGGGGASYTDGDLADIERAAAFHRRHGTTSTLASLVTASPADLLAGLRALAESTRSGVIAGIHVEGPWLSPARGGAHDVGQLRDPDAAEVDAVLAAGDGAVRMVTLAPERFGSAAAISRLVDTGIVVAVGHTDATYEQTRQAIDAGATVGTHLFNAMRPLHHREPGPVLALLEDPRVTVELIADGVHLHPAVVRAVIDAVGPQRVALVTDATTAAGLGDGAFRLGRVQIDVAAGVACVHGTSTVAGSTATMDRLFRAAAAAGADRKTAHSDAALAAAVQVTSTTPARVLRLEDAGTLRPGSAADLVVLDEGLQVRAVMAGGDWVTGG
jgi:N-acetylglucosamine-6-phosphate deacetylase